MKVHPDKILENLKGKTNTRAARNLDIVHDVCREIYNAPGPKDYSYATVGRRTQERNGPSLNTYYSPKGVRFCDLVKAWADYDGADMKRPNKPIKERKDHELLTSINDLVLRGRVGLLLAKCSRLESEVNALKANAKVVIDQRPAPAGVRASGGQLLQVFSPFASLLDTELEALQVAITDKWLDGHGMKRGSAGEVLDSKGRVIFPIGFLNALTKVVEGYKSKE